MNCQNRNVSILVRSFSIFLVLMPIWMYFRVVEFRSATIIKDVLLLIGASYWFVWIIHNRRANIFVPNMLFLFIIVPTLLLSGLGFEFFLRLRPYVQMLLLVGIPLLTIQLRERQVLRIFHSIVLSGALFATIALIHYFIDPHLFLPNSIINESVFMIYGDEPVSAFLGPRLQSITGNPNNLGQIMLITTLISLGFISDERLSFRQRLPYIVISGISVLLVMLSRSRSDIVMLIICISIFILYVRQWRIVVLGSVSVLIGLLANFKQIWLVFKRFVTKGNNRTGFWSEAIDIFGNKLLIGGNDIAILPGVIDSTYLQMLIETGIVGLALFLYLSGKLLFHLHRSSWNKPQIIPVVVIVVLVAILGNNIFRTGLYVFPFNLYFWLFFAIGYSYLGK